MVGIAKDGFCATGQEEDFYAKEKVTKYRRTGKKVTKKILGIKYTDYEEEPYDIILPCTIRYGRVAVTFKMAEVESTRLIAIKSITREYKEKLVKDPDSPKTLKPKEVILDDLVDQTTNEFIAQISAHYVTKQRTWEAMKKHGFLSNPKEKSAFSYFKNGLYAEASRALDVLMNDPELKPNELATVYYNRGLIYEISKNLVKAEEWYKKATDLKPSDLHLKALKDIKERIEATKKLQEQGL